MDENEATAPTEQPDEPQEPPKRGRGRPKGLPKTGGRQKKRWDIAQLRDDLVRLPGIERLREIIEGKPQNVTGPTGKTYQAYPSIDQRLKALDLWARKIAPDLQSTAVTGADNTPLTVDVERSPRDVARAVLDIVRTAPLADMQAPTIDVIDNRELWARASERSRDSIETGNGEPVSLPTPYSDIWAAPSGHPYVNPAEKLPPGMAGDPVRVEQYQVGERILIGEQGHAIEYVMTLGDGRSRWWVLDANGMRIASVVGKDEAEAKCLGLIKTGKVSR